MDCSITYKRTTRFYNGVGDFGQLPAVEDEDEDIELDRTWVVKHVFSTRWYELTEPHRATDPMRCKDDKKPETKNQLTLQNIIVKSMI